MIELLIHPEELTERWVALAKKHKLKRLSIHPWGGKKAHETLAGLLQELETPEFRTKIDALTDSGVEIGYEFHAASYLLPRTLFEAHPEYFRMNEEGERVPELNFCFSNEEACEIVAKNAAVLAKKLYRSQNDYYFWLDDARKAQCHCSECQKHTFADHQLKVMNRILRELRKDDPNARLCYLAYFEALSIPQEIKPEEGIFLEYAPLERFDDRENIAPPTVNLKALHGLLEFFGAKDAKVLEYWYDNSMFSRWKKPPVAFYPNNAQIKEEFAFYNALGFEILSSFACFLGDDYVSLYGEPDLSAISD